MSTYNPCHVYDHRKIKCCLDNLRTSDMKQAFGQHKVILGTRQPRSLRSFLVSSRGLRHCTGICKYHELGYVIKCLTFTFGLHDKFTWVYNRLFNCNSLNVIYVLKCNNCWRFYIGETHDLKERTRLHISNVNLPDNANCRILSHHLHTCSKLAHPYFTIYPIYYVEDRQRRRFIEKRFIKRYKPPLNGDE